MIVVSFRTLPQNRPFWWVHEYHHNAIHIHQSPLSCETTAGFPSSHSMAFTGLVFILLCHAKLSLRISYLAVTLLSIPMWIARIYFGTHFLHQCICGSFVAVFVIETIRRLQERHEKVGVIFIETWRKTIAIAAVAAVGLFVIGIYFAMLSIGLDPHWSVRMVNVAFNRHFDIELWFVFCSFSGIQMVHRSGVFATWIESSFCYVSWFRIHDGCSSIHSTFKQVCWVFISSLLVTSVGIVTSKQSQYNSRNFLLQAHSETRSE